VSWILDTDVITELRKGEQANPGLLKWFRAVDDEMLFISVVVLGELRHGVEVTRLKDPQAGDTLDQWLADVTAQFDERILPIDEEVAEQWGVFGMRDPISAVDGLVAATALVHGCTVVTRHEDAYAGTDVTVLNPFDGP